MNDTRKSSRTSPGCLVLIGVGFVFCLGSYWTVMMMSYTEWSLAPSTAQGGVISTREAEPAYTLERTIIPSLTLPPESTSSPTTRSLTVAPNSHVSFSIPVTGKSCIPNNLPQTGKVIQVMDGDTIKVLLDQDGLTYSVRYIGIDAMKDTSQVEQFGSDATAKNAEFVYDKTVTLIRDVSETDQYGRLLRYVVTGDVFVNY